MNNDIKRNFNNNNRFLPDASPPNIITDILNADEEDEIVQEYMLK
jgi:hypothetical protein